MSDNNPPVETNPLTDVEKSSCRDFMGYPAAGLANVFSNYRFFTIYGQMEFRFSNLSDSECAQVRAYLMQLTALQAAFYTTSGNLDTAQAGVWTHNKNEISDRRRLYNMVRLDLCGLFGLPPGPRLTNSNNITLIV